MYQVFGINAITFIITVLQRSGWISFNRVTRGRGGCLAGVVLWSKSLKESRDLLTVDVLERVYCEIARAAPDIFLAFLQSNPRGAGSRTAEWEVGVCGPHAGESSIGERHATHHPVCCKLHGFRLLQRSIHIYTQC